MSNFDEIKFKLQKLEQWLELDREIEALTIALRQVESKKRHLEYFFFDRTNSADSANAKIFFSDLENIKQAIADLERERSLMKEKNL